MLHVYTCAVYRTVWSLQMTNLTPNKQVYYVRNKICQTTKQTAGCLNCLSMTEIEIDSHLTDFDPVTAIL